jgi:hypothetical protein
MGNRTKPQESPENRAPAGTRKPGLAPLVGALVLLVLVIAALWYRVTYDGLPWLSGGH